MVRRELIAVRTSDQRPCQVSRQRRKSVVQTKRCARISEAGTAARNFQKIGMMPQKPKAAMPASNALCSSRAVWEGGAAERTLLLFHAFKWRAMLPSLPKP